MTDQLSTGLEGVRESLLDDDNPMDQVAARRRLRVLSDELGLPMPPNFDADDFNEDIMRDAIEEQIDRVEARVPKMQNATLKKWKDRGKIALPLFWHTPVGKEWLRRIVFSGKWTQTQMAMMTGIRAGMLEDYMRGQGWTQQILSIKREKDTAEYHRLSQELLFKGKCKTMEAAVKLTEYIGSLDAREGISRIHDLKQLHGVMTDVFPVAKGEEAIDPAMLPAINVGVTVVSHRKKTFDPAAAAKKAQAAEVQPNPTLEDT